MYKNSFFFKKLYFVIVLHFNFFFGFAQNLVINSSFEDLIKCPNLGGQINYCTGWDGYGGSPDYYNACDTSSYVGVPSNDFGNQNALLGNAYSGFIGYASMFQDVREMIGRKLSAPLIKGNKYYISLHVSLGESSKYACNNLGISFSTVSRVNDNLNFVNKNRPFIYTKSIIKDYSNWVNIKGSFISDSNYQFVIIGNFLTDSLTNHEFSSSPNVSTDFAYYYVDDVCVSSDSLTCVNKTGVKTLTKEKNTIAYPNPFSDKITIKVNQIDETKVVIYDKLSKEIERHSFSDAITLDLEYLPNGIYFYEISNYLGVIERGKLIK